MPLLGKANIGIFSALAGGIVVGLLITPLIASISEDAMRAVPRGMREGAYAMGATKFEVVRKVVFPAAVSGIMASIILAMSRAIGETMAVLLAVGDKPQLTFDPTESVQTMTAFIAQIAIGETPQGSIQFKSLFAVGATLFVMTLVLNLLSSLGRPQVPDGLLMTASDRRTAVAAPGRPVRAGAHAPQADRARSSTARAWLAIGILLLALVILLVDVLVRGLPWLDPHFLTGVPSRRPRTRGILPALVGSFEVGHDRRGLHASRSASPPPST